jgi:hypothetical protein
MLAVFAAWGLMPQDASAEARRSAPGDLFYNYYVPPAGPGSVGAQLYPAPRPTPPLVGHTYMTYQPLYPQEFLYPHHRAYWAADGCKGVTMTNVWWLRTPRLWPLQPSLGWSVPSMHTRPAGPGSSCMP